MSERRQRGYYFASSAQWRECVMSGAGVSGREGAETVRPFAPYQSIAAPSLVSDGAFAPAFSRTREVLWHDGVDRLHRLDEGDDHPRSVVAPDEIIRALRMIATANDLWVANKQPQSLQCFDAATLSRRFVVKTDHSRIIDIAADVRNGVAALVEHNGALECVRIDCAGQIGATIALEGLVDARAFAFLYGPGRFAVLTSDAKALCWFSADGTALWRTQLATLAPCFVAETVSSDTARRVFVAGADQKVQDSGYRVLTFDDKGAFVDSIAIPEPATGLAAKSDNLLVTTQSGLYRLSTVDSVPADVPEVCAMILTPALEAPETTDGRRWLRAEVSANLPPGTTLEIAYVATDDKTKRKHLQEIADDTIVPPDLRLKRLRAEYDWRSWVFHGDATLTQDTPAPLAIPLYEQRKRYLWIYIVLVAGPGAKLPSLSRLSVLYPGRTLMENLPSIYQRDESNPESFLRTLVGVLETTTQTLDARIATMGDLIHPVTAPPNWLDFVARWLGLPWDDALEPRQKKCIVEHAAQIAKERGTRAGLETLLGCLFPDSPRRFRIADLMVDFGFAIVSGEACRGRALPAFLGGASSSAAQLGVRTTLGRMRLPCASAAEDDSVVSRLAGMIRVDIAANAPERGRWSPWLESMLQEMTPITARLTVRWLGVGALRSNRLGEATSLEAPAPPRLGANAILGGALLPGRPATLPISITDAEPTLH